MDKSPQEFQRQSQKALQQVLNYSFKDPALALLALTHPSSLSDQRLVDGDNQRLEFLGDSVLGFIVVQQLFQDHPNLEEGPLTQLKNLIVSTPVLAEAARVWHLGDLVFLGQSEKISGGAKRDSLLADLFEAVLGAVYLDGGLQQAKTLVEFFVLSKGLEFAQKNHLVNYRNALLEHFQEKSGEQPKYTTVAEQGPEHCKIYEVEVSVSGGVLARGSGSSKAKGAMEAARLACEKLEISVWM